MRAPAQIPEAERDYYLERRYPSFGNLVPETSLPARRRSVRRRPRRWAGRAGCLSGLRHAIQRLGQETVRESTEICSTCTKNYRRRRVQSPMRIYPAPHYTMGGLWVDYHLMSTIPGLFVGGEANFSDHGANRLGASALMQGLADGYFVLPYTVPNYIASTHSKRLRVSHPAFAEIKDEV